MTVQADIFITDRQLCERWHCPLMKLYRLRGQGVLPKPTKIGVRGRNLTPMQVVRELENEGAQ